VEDPAIRKVFHNAFFDIIMMKWAGWRIRGPIEDTLILAHVVTGGSEPSYGLKPLAKKYVSFSDEDQLDLRESVKRNRHIAAAKGWYLATTAMGGRDAIAGDFWLGDKKLLKKYAIGDVERTMLLYQLMKPELKQATGLMETYRLEMRLMQVLIRMAWRGVRIHPEKEEELRAYYNKYAAHQLKILAALGFGHVKPRSRNQVASVLFDPAGPFGLPPVYYTAKGNAKADGDTLQKIADGQGYPEKAQQFSRAILEYKGATAATSSFLDPYKRLWVGEMYAKLDPSVKILHGGWRQMGTATGRLSCGEPNMMNVASPDSGRRHAWVANRPRDCFGPREGYIWYMADYSQLQVWIFAAVAQSSSMLKALLSGKDFHDEIARQVWGSSADYETQRSYYRKCAKLLMFCKLFGGGPKKVAFLLKSELSVAQKFVRDYEQRLPDVVDFMNRTVREVYRSGEFSDPFGRRYRIDQDFAYKAVNYKVQGSEAGTMKRAMVAVDDMFHEKWDNKPALVLTIHDELVAEVPEEVHCKALMRDMVGTMQRVAEPLKLPTVIPVKMKITRTTWSRATEVKLA
jgi:DNA polymerase-1